MQNYNKLIIWNWRKIFWQAAILRENPESVDKPSIGDGNAVFFNFLNESTLVAVFINKQRLNSFVHFSAQFPQQRIYTKLSSAIFCSEDTWIPFL